MCFENLANARVQSQSVLEYRSKEDPLKLYVELRRYFDTISFKRIRFNESTVRRSPEYQGWMTVESPRMEWPVEIRDRVLSLRFFSHFKNRCSIRHSTLGDGKQHIGSDP